MKTGNVDAGVGTNGRVTDDITTDGIGEAGANGSTRRNGATHGILDIGVGTTGSMIGNTAR